jgi:hypothetical protein
MAQTGRYIHDADNKAYVRFASHGDTDRIFTVLVADAYDAGIIGSEYNGLVILENGREDHNGMHALLDRRHCGNKAAALRELEAIKEMDWPQFLDFVRSAKEYQGNLLDERDLRAAEKNNSQDEIDYFREKPAAGNRRNLIAMGLIDLSDEPDIRPQELIDIDADPKNDYSYPKIGREGIIAELLNHSWYRHGRYGDFHLEWDVKMHMNLDETGKLGEKVNDEYDDRWKKYYDDNEFVEDSIFNEVTSNMADHYRNGYTTYPGDDYGHYELAFEGRSSGHMVLRKMDGVKMGASGMAEAGEMLAEMDDDDLVKLWKVVRALDHDITPEKLAQDWAYNLGLERSNWEERLESGLEDDEDDDLDEDSDLDADDECENPIGIPRVPR